MAPKKKKIPWRKRKWAEPKPKRVSFSDIKLGKFKEYAGTFKGTLEEYTDLWQKFYDEFHQTPEWGSALRNRFYDGIGEYIDERGLKYRPNTRVDKKPGRNLSNVDDAGALQRIHREEIITYIFGHGASPAKTSDLRYQNELGEVVEAHHKFANAELGPWVDDIIEDLLHPKGSTRYQIGMKKLESGRRWFRETPYFAGGVEENFEGLTKLQHRGKGASIHNELGPVRQLPNGDWVGSNITGPMGRTPFAPGGSKLSQGIRPHYANYGPNLPRIPTLDVIRSLPYGDDAFIWTKEGEQFGKKFLKGRRVDFLNFKRGGPVPRRDIQTRWSTLEDFMEQSGPIRDEMANYARIDPRVKSPKELKHIAGGGRPPTPGTSWAQRAAERFDTPMAFTLNGMDGTAALRHVGAVEDPLRWAARRAGSFIPIAGAALDEVDRRERTKELNRKMGTFGYEGSYEHRMDQLQLRLAEGTVASSFWAEPVNVGAGLTNLAIDIGRTLTEEEKRKNALDTARHIGTGVDNLLRASVSTLF